MATQPLNAPTAASPSANVDPNQGDNSWSGTSGTTGIGTFDNKNGNTRVYDVVRNYRWTLSNKLNRDDIPEIILSEHRNEESAIKRQLLFYFKALGGQLTSEVGKAADALSYLNLLNPGIAVGSVISSLFGGSGSTSPEDVANNPQNANGKLLDVYEEIFPDNPTKNKYYFPYFTKTFLELNSPQWEQLDDIGSSVDNLLKGGGNLAKSLGDALGLKSGNVISKWANIASETMNAGTQAGLTYLKTQYPVVGIFDRPRIFSSHNERELTIEFPLYNTYEADDWKRNRNLLYKLMTQFLYIKNSYVTGYPPVFYRVLVPGQYFSYASCVTNFNVTNLGNIRKLYGYHVPDAYQVTITLKEMCMPSLNQFQAMTTGEAAGKVEASVEVGVAPGARGTII